MKCRDCGAEETNERKLWVGFNGATALCECCITLRANGKHVRQAWAETETERWIRRYNALDKWRAQTSRLHLEAEAKLRKMQTCPECCAKLVSVCPSCRITIEP